MEVVLKRLGILVVVAWVGVITYRVAIFGDARAAAFTVYNRPVNTTASGDCYYTANWHGSSWSAVGFTNFFNYYAICANGYVMTGAAANGYAMAGSWVWAGVVLTNIQCCRITLS
jgi:hypothetical protein